MPDYNINHVGKFSCNLVLDPDNLYRPGGFVKGHFYFTNKDRVNCYGIVAFVGAEATVAFKIAGDLKRSRKIIFLNLFDIWGNMWEHYKCRKAPICSPLPSGKHTLPFEFTLPQNTPGTYTNTYVKIKYEVGAALITMANGCPNICNKNLEVENHVNLFLRHELLLPTQLEVTENKYLFAFFKRKSKNLPKLKFFLELTKTGFVQGEELPFVLKIENPRDQLLQSVSASLVRKVICKAEGSVKTIEEVVAAEHFLTEKEFNTEIKWCHKLLLPKGLTPSFEAIEAVSLGCPYYNDNLKIIQLLYIFKIFINQAEGGPPLKGEIPITIGTECEMREIETSQYLNSESMSCTIGNRSRSDTRKTSKSIETGGSLLPSYSQLSFFLGGSMISLGSVETLPPTYEDCMKK